MKEAKMGLTLPIRGYFSKFILQQTAEEFTSSGGEDTWPRKQHQSPPGAVAAAEVGS